MSTALEIINDARTKFLTINNLHNIGCTADDGDQCSLHGINHYNCDNNNQHEYIDSIVNPPDALYCAGFDTNIHCSETSAYTCPGHRDFEYINRYPLPTSLQSNTIIYANQLTQLYLNIKTEITERLKHVFYSNLEF